MFHRKEKEQARQAMRAAAATNVSQVREDTSVILQWNVNGIRACFKNGGLEECIRRVFPNIIVLPELKITSAKLAKQQDLMHSFSEWDMCLTNFSGATYLIVDIPV